MLNSLMVGSYISKLRKDKDLTQMELANHVNVSHQAVSKWERGESLPDLGTLVELAKLFEISVDDLLKGGPKGEMATKKEPFILNIIEGQSDEAAKLMNAGTVKVNDLVDMAPLIKASLLGKLTSNVDESVFSIQHLVDLAPFLMETSLNELIKKLNPKGLSIHELTHFAPFISKELLIDLFNRSELINTKGLVHIAPFLDEDIVTLLDNMPIDVMEWSEIRELAPFMESKSLIDLAVKKSGGGTLSIKHAQIIAPFMDDEMDLLIEHLLIEELEINDISGLLPFLEKDKMIALIKKMSGKLTMKHIVMMAPFLEEDEFGIILEDESVEMTPQNLAALAPFLDQKSLIKFIEKCSNMYEVK